MSPTPRGGTSVWVLPLLAATVAGCCAQHPVIHGTTAPGYEEVRQELERSFLERGERGAAVAAYHHGVKVVDLWAGERNAAHEPWEEDTLVPIFSTTKGLAALTLAVAHARGLFDYDAPVAKYWPEFAQQGKDRITVRQLLAHEAGLVLFDAELTFEIIRDPDNLDAFLARQRPLWEPGTRHGYHLSTLGFYMGALLRRVDPEHRTLGRFFHEEIAQKLGVEVYIGAPATLDPHRVARVTLPSPAGGLLHVFDPPGEVLARLLSPFSIFTQSLAIPKGFDANDPPWWTVELPSGNGLASARAVARIYGSFAKGGAELGITQATIASLEAPPTTPTGGAEDAVLGVDNFYSLGFIKPQPTLDWGSSLRAYGMPGAGGSFAFADPDHELGFAYVMTRMGYFMSDDPREASLRNAVLRAARRLDGPRASTERGGARPKDE